MLSSSRPGMPIGPRRVTELGAALSLSAALCAALGVATPAVAQTASDSVEIKLSGDVRVRSEMDARTSGAGSDHATLLRSRIALLAEVGEEVSALIQISDSRVFGEETNTLTDASADRLDVHQAYIAWTPNEKVRLRAGRQEIAFADERLVGTVNWTNVTRALDGVRLTLFQGGWTVDGFATVLDERAALLATGLNPRTNEDDASDRSLFGLWAANSNVDLFALADRNATDGTSRTDIDRFTLGARGREQLGSVALEATAALQLGRQTQTGLPRQDIEAFLLTANGTYGFEGPLRGRLGIQVDYLSGDDTPLDDSFGGFNTLYATNHKFYGFMDFFLNLPRQTGDLGLVDAMVRGAVHPQAWTLRADLHRFWLAHDSPAGERGIGTELDLTASRTLAPGLGFQAGYSLFSPSAAGEVAPVGLGGDTLHWAYVQLFARF
ncbi:MAG: alginate export family protein [Gemmatimonadota bacterium]